ncbi:MAG: hypothetical protein ABH871_09475 [Pseudomonadota bacterium]
MSSNKDISILDVTIRDGSYAINYQYTPEQVSDVASALDEAGIDFIEVSHGCGLGAGENLGLLAKASDAEYVLAAKKEAKHSKIGVIAGGPPVTFERDIDTIIDDVDFIRFAANCDNPRTIEANIKYARKKRPDLMIFVQLMRCTRRPKSVILESAKQAADMGVDVLYVVDTAGHFLPEEVSEIVDLLVAKSGIGIGFHGHNNLGLAIANTLAAIKAGACSVDASLRGMGRAGGNAQLEALVSLLHRMGLAKSVDLDLLAACAQGIIEPIMPRTAGIAEIDVLTGDANIDLYPIEFYQRIAKSAALPLLDLIRELGNDDKAVEADLDAIQRALENLGADADKVLKSVGIIKR